MRYLLTILLTSALSAGLSAQTYDGYTLYSKMGSTKAYLLNMDKTIYHTWTCNPATGYSTYLMPNQVLLRTAQYSGNQLSGAAMCGMVQKLDWNGNVTWQYIHSSSTYCTHHDICPMPNGNVLLISYEVKSPSEVTQAGCSQNITMWPDKIIEVQPSGANTGTIVWEWHAWDHLCQNVNAAKDNYVTSIAQHPELLNINYATQKDWMHTNGIDYNPTLDQIVFSSHNLNEIYVIDHSTTTAEAAGHTGGNSGKGGDILYRWGNPQVYSCGTSSNQIFKVVHDAHWIDEGCPHANDLVGFNNQGMTGNHSCVDRITPPYNGFTYSGTAGTAYAPSTFNYRHDCLGDAGNQSNSQQLPNGNTLVCIATTGYIYEIDSNQNLLWSHTVGGTNAKAFRYSPCYVNGTLSVDASASPYQVCSGSSSQLNATVSNGTATSYLWTSNPPGFNSTSQNPVVFPTINTTYFVTAYSGTCQASDSVIVTVEDAFSVAIGATDDTVCSGQEVQLTATPNTSGNYTYSWISDPPGFSSTTQNPLAFPTVTTEYTVTVSNGLCTSSNSYTITVDAPFSLQATASPESVCYGNQSQLNVLITGPSASYTFLWNSNPSGFTSVQQNPVVTPVSTTVYTVTVSNGSCSMQAVATVNVTGPLLINAMAYPGQLCMGENSQLDVSASGGNVYAYSWTSDPAGFNSVIQNPVVTPVVTTKYFVVVESLPCVATDSTLIMVDALPAQPVIHQSGDTLYSSSETGNQWYRNTEKLVGETRSYLPITISGSYQVEVINEEGCISALSEAFLITSMSDVSGNLDVRLYPIPSTGLIYHTDLRLLPKIEWMMLGSIEGKLILSDTPAAFYDLSTLPDGIYIMTFILKDHNALRIKIIIAR
jgi:hypothetical protein